jgi:hypothetical protein
LPQGDAGIGQIFGRPSEHPGIAIESDEFSVRTQVFEEDTAVSAGSYCSVDDGQPRREVKELDDFP